MKNILIKQDGGIGDILFVEPLVRKFYISGSEIYWRISNDGYRDDLKRHFPYINWTGSDNGINTHKINVIDFQTASRIVPDPQKLLESKYMILGVPLDYWRSLSWNRDFERERNLIKDLNINIEEPYRLIHKVYGSNGTKQYINEKIPENDSIKNIEITNIPGYSILDWGTIIENADEIHFVSTCTMYMAEILNLKSNVDLHLYPRLFDLDFSHTINIHKKDWVLHYGRH